jgi:hypothetical protein
MSLTWACVCACPSTGLDSDPLKLVMEQANFNKMTEQPYIMEYVKQVRWPRPSFATRPQRNLGATGCFQSCMSAPEVV